MKLFQQYTQQINQAMEAMLACRAPALAPRLHQAMHYSLMAGGKRVRPSMMMVCHTACHGSLNIMPAMMSIECMHTYSLIHDDLPCMDNDDLRRGKPSCHKQFNEEIAVLAGDALQALSFELLTELDTSPALIVDLSRRLSIAAGAHGMVGGQQLDMEAESQPLENVLDVERIHVHKTGALLRYCCEAGALLAAADQVKLDACSRYGKAVGLLFQIADDILDATAATETLGKYAGKDADMHKATYVSVAGLSSARQWADEMLEVACTALEPLGEEAAVLKTLAQYVHSRQQ